MRWARRLRDTLEAASQRGFLAAVQTLVLGARKYHAMVELPFVEPMLLRPPDVNGLSAQDRSFTRCSDIYAHLPTLFRITVERRLKRVLELGVGRGESTRVLLTAAREIDGHVTSIDLGPCDEARAAVREAGLSEFWTFVQADDVAIDWDEPIEHLFIDTSHLFEHTLGELEKYEPHVVGGGVVSIHDTTSFPSVRRAIEAYFAGRGDVRVFHYYHNNGLALIEKLD